MEIKLYLKDSAAIFEFDNVMDTFQEGDMFCIYCKMDANGKREVTKFPIMHIFKVKQID